MVSQVNHSQKEFIVIMMGVPLYCIFWLWLGWSASFLLLVLGWSLLIFRSVAREICWQMGSYWTCYDASFADQWYLAWGLCPQAARPGQLRAVADRRGANWYLLGAWLGCPKCLHRQVGTFFLEKRYSLITYYQDRAQTAQYYYYLGKIYLAQGNPKQAVSAWTTGSHLVSDPTYAMDCIRSLLRQNRSLEEQQKLWSQGAELGDMECRFRIALFSPIREQFPRLMDLTNEHYFSAAADLVDRAYLLKNHALNILVIHPDTRVNLRDLRTLLRWKEYEYIDGLTRRLYDRYAARRKFIQLLLQVNKIYLSGKVLALRTHSAQQLVDAAASLRAYCVRDIIQLVTDYI